MERQCYQYVSDWQMAFRDRIQIFVQALVSALLHSVSPNRARILKTSSSTLQQPCRSPQSLIINTCSESSGWPVEPFLMYNLFKHEKRWDLLHVNRWHYTCSGASWKREAGGSWLWGFHSHTSAEYDPSSQKMSHNFEQNSCESLAPSGCHRLHEKRKKNVCRWAGKNKHKVCSGQNISYFVKSLWSSLFVRTCDRCRPLCTVLGLPRSANYRVFMCLARQVAGLQASNQTSPSHFYTLTTPIPHFWPIRQCLSETRQEKQISLLLWSVSDRSSQRRTHQVWFQDKCKYRGQNVSWLSWRVRCPLGAIKGVT